MNGRNTFIFDSLPEKELIPRFEISSFHWEKYGYSRPESSVRFCAVKNEGYYAFLESISYASDKEYINKLESIVNKE